MGVVPGRSTWSLDVIEAPREMSTMVRIIASLSFGVVLCVVSWGIHLPSALYNAMFFANFGPILIGGVFDPPSLPIMYIATVVQWALLAYLVLWIAHIGLRRRKTVDDV
jgi:hypothetical protein